MRIMAESNKQTLRWALPSDCVDVFPSLKKLKRGNTKDAEDKLTGVWGLIKRYKLKNQSWHEPFGGIGMTAQLAQTNGMFVSVNELNRSLYNYLKMFYDDVTLKDAEKLEMSPVDYRFYDPSHFTFNHLCSSFYQSLLMTRKTLLYTDVYPFCLKPFDKKKLANYLLKSQIWMMSAGWNIESFYLYRSNNAMIVKARRNNFTKQIIDVVKNDDPFKITIGTGLFK